MKSSYKLLSIYLDHKNIPERKPIIKEKSPEEMLLSLEMEYSIFDLEIYQRMVLGTSILACETRDELETNLILAEPCDCIWIMLDFCTDMEAVNLLYMKRVLQAMLMFQEKWQDKRIGLMSEIDRIRQYNIILDQIYE